MRDLLRPLSGLHLKIRSTWTVIIGLVVWFLATVFLPQEYPEWPTWLQWLTATATALLLLGTAVVHELTHAIVARRRHVVVKGSSEFVDDGGDNPWLSRPARPLDELLPALAGPAINLVLAVALWLLATLVGLFLLPASIALAYAAIVSLLLGVFNLLPIFPLDGGWILRAVVWRATGDRGRATEIAVNTARLAGYVAVVAGLLVIVQGQLVAGAWLLGAGTLAANAAGAERDRQRQSAPGGAEPEARMSGSRLSRVMARADWLKHGLRGERPADR